MSKGTTSDSRLGAAIKEMARIPGGVGKSIQIVVDTGDWQATYEIKLLRVTTKAQMKTARRLVSIQPINRRPAPGK